MIQGSRHLPLNQFPHWLRNIILNRIRINIYRHGAIDLADPRSMQDACHIWTSWWASFTIESLWLSCTASQRGIRRPEVPFFIGTQNFFFVPRSWQDAKHLAVLFWIFEDYHCYVNHRDVIRPVVSMVDPAFLTKTNRHFNVRARLLGLEKDV